MHISIFKFVSAAKPKQFKKKQQKKKQVMGKRSTSPSEYTSADTICETDIRTRDKPSSACSVSRLTETDRNRPMKIPKQTSMGTETDRNGLQWVPKQTGTDFSSYLNELQWEPEKVGWGTIGTILIKLCMY